MLGSGIINDEDLVFVEGNILRSNVNGIPTIDFSDRIKKWLVKDMATTVVVKLLGRNISYRVLHSGISNLWRPSQPFQLMDVENGYYLVRFQSKVDYNMVFGSRVIGCFWPLPHCSTLDG